MTTPIRDLYLDVAALVAELLADPAVAAAWDRPSALDRMSVRGLAGHTAGQVFFLPKMLATPVPTEEPIGLHEYYARVSWIGSDLDNEFNTVIRTHGEQEAGADPAGLAARVADCVADLRETLVDAPNRPVHRPTWGAWSIRFDDFVTSRLLELVVHGDDLAHSVGVPTPEFPPAAVEIVVDVLSRIAVRRHGATSVLRALSRAERAPATISAL